MLQQEVMDLTHVTVSDKTTPQINKNRIQDDLYEL